MFVIKLHFVAIHFHNVIMNYRQVFLFLVLQRYFHSVCGENGQAGLTSISMCCVSVSEVNYKITVVL